MTIWYSAVSTCSSRPYASVFPVWFFPFKNPSWVFLEESLRNTVAIFAVLGTHTQRYPCVVRTPCGWSVLSTMYLCAFHPFNGSCNLGFVANLHLPHGVFSPFRFFFGFGRKKKLCMRNSPTHETHTISPHQSLFTSASIARQVYIRPGIGMGHLKRHYGGSVNRGYRPSHHGDAATGNIRKALQGLSDLGIVVDGDKGGRYISEKGRTDLDRVAAQVALARQQAQINPLDI
eukprot:TRINITY_DN1716_c0_g2_i1.p1 TRINITY_DN1716_c0_g2~~TRINITY_DN1716_c0_g2_i1.p1  ORF type:complete len:232 (+),score=14.63 TRINITY_DN1716_c0_g2_i1:403-1098(+)